MFFGPFFKRGTVHWKNIFSLHYVKAIWRSWFLFASWNKFIIAKCWFIEFFQLPGIYIYIYIYIYVCVCVCNICVRMWIYIYIYIYVYAPPIYIYIYIYIYKYIYIYICACVGGCVCVCLSVCPGRFSFSAILQKTVSVFWRLCSWKESLFPLQYPYAILHLVSSYIDMILIM